MDVELRTHTSNPSLAFRDLHRWPSSPPLPAGWRATLVVRSGPFAAELPFYFDEGVLDEFVVALGEMDRALRGQAILQTPNEEPCIRVVVGQGGQVTVSGLVVQEHGAGQRLEFGFITDQTVLAPLARDWEKARRALVAAGLAAT